MKNWKTVWLCVLALSVSSCDDGDDGTDAGPAMTDAGPSGMDAGPDDDDAGPGELDGGGGLTVPDTYAFDSRFEPGTSSVAHTGQTARQLLIQRLKAYVDGLTDAVDGGLDPTAADPADASRGIVMGQLEYFFSLDGGDRAADPIDVTTDPAADQMTWGDISDASLLGKVAGNDAVTDHRDWSSEFAGWSDASIASDGGGIDSPTNFVRAIFATVEQNAIARGTGVDRFNPADGTTQLPVHVTASGVDLGQLLAKFLLGAINFSQAADDYADGDIDGKGLLADNTMQSGDSPYTGLEHAWDEAFGYFGASARYDDWTAAELAAGPVYRDLDSSGGIDFLTEYNFGASVNAAKRDNGATTATDFMGTAFTAFRTGRAIITHADGALDADAMAALTEQRDLAIGAWEMAIAATVVHYINDTLEVMQDYGTADWDAARFLDLAKAWSEMKGFAMMFQFNPRSPMLDDFAMFHTLVGDAPVLPDAGETAVSDYETALRDARALLGTAYGFDAANLGDDVGAGGW